VLLTSPVQIDGGVPSGFELVGNLVFEDWMLTAVTVFRLQRGSKKQTLQPRCFANVESKHFCCA
jgi:hypothetical protein